ncbi:hypothetical protein ACWGQ9_20860 [Streptomyces parvus]
MAIQMLTLWIRGRYTALKASRDAGSLSGEMAYLTAAVLVLGGMVVVAIRTNVLGNIGIIGGE